MTSPDLQQAVFRLRLGSSEEELELTPGEASSRLDALLAERGAETLVFLPLRKPRKKAKRSLLEKERKKQRAKLGQGEWHEGVLARKEMPPIAAAWCLDLPRTEARVIAEGLGLDEFYWARPGSTVEVHSAKLFSGDDAFDLSKLRVRSREGLKDMLQTAFDLSCLAEAARAAGSTLTRFRLAAAFTLFVTLAISVLSLVPSLWFSPENVPRLVDLAIHPILVPAFLFGAYLRGTLRLSGKLEESTHVRELDREEAARKWDAVAPHELAVWIVLGTCVSLLTLTALIAAGDFTAARFVEDAIQGTLIALWLLTPLAYSRDLSSAFGACIEAAITLVIAIFTIKLTLAFTSLATGILWGVLTALVSFEIANWIKDPFEAITSIAAELLLGTLFLGYTWSKARENFSRWATTPVNESA